MADKEEPLGGAFVVEAALSVLGIWGNDRATVEAAIPEAQIIADTLNHNMGTINAAVALLNQVMPHVQKVAPAAQIVIDAVAKKQAGA